jgi:hypothetical protein
VKANLTKLEFIPSFDKQPMGLVIDRVLTGLPNHGALSRIEFCMPLHVVEATVESTKIGPR